MWNLDKLYDIWYGEFKEGIKRFWINGWNYDWGNYYGIKR